MNIQNIFLSVVMTSPFLLKAQAPTTTLTVTRTQAVITIDGLLEEQAWQNITATTPFQNQWPLDSGNAAKQTEVKLLFNDDFIYVAAINYQKRSDLIIQTLKRDQIDAFWNSDGFSVLFDPMTQKSTGFLFGVNAGGAQLEGAI